MLPVCMPLTRWDTTAMNKVVISLTEKDLIELHAVLLDEDEKGALAFLRRCVAPRIPVRGTAACDSSRRNPYLMPPDPGPAPAGDPSR